MDPMGHEFSDGLKKKNVIWYKSLHSFPEMQSAATYRTISNYDITTVNTDESFMV